jgi:predicted metal-dependent hydrolase
MNETNGCHRVSWAAAEIEFQLIRSHRRTLSITVRPDLSVRITAPLSASVDSILQKVQRRARWILKQQRIFRDYLPTTPPRRFVAGETHRYLGRQYRLKIDEGHPETVRLRGQFLRVTIAGKHDTVRVARLVKGWFRQHARAQFERLLTLALARLPALWESRPQLRLRTMPRRWGSCTKQGVIYLNPELVQAPRSCIDYVLTHELCHLLHPHHGRAFYILLQTLIPDWKSRKERLEKSLN